MSWMVKDHVPRNDPDHGVARDDSPKGFTHDVSRLCQLSFLRVFTEDLSRLYQLSFLLTCDHEKAVQCFIAALEDCLQGNSAFSIGARSCAKRAVIEQAVLELKPRPSQATEPSAPKIFPNNQLSSGPGGHFALEAVLALEDFDRFIFVMSVLEDYSPDDCSRLLGCSPSAIREARTHALEELAHSVHIVSAHNPSVTQEGK
jgi:Sigma-70, region 4